MEKGWIDSDTFSCFVPAQMVVVKGGEKGADKTGKRWIQGIASTDGRDLQGEVIDQSGIDFSYFLKQGYFNDDHKSGPEFKVGQPTEAKITKNGLWVKGFLFKNPNPNEESRADFYWKLMNQLNASESDRKVGFSIQGKVLRRNGNKIEKCWIQDIAITTQPVNTATWAEIAKSLASQKWDLEKEEDSEEKKAVKKAEKEEAEKALSVGAGNPVVPQSLEGKQKNVVTVNKSMLTYDEACSVVKSKTGLSDNEAVKAIVNVAFGLFGQE
jgi:nitrate reductase cytochrome c-type subunit